MGGKNYYDLLGIESGALPEEIKRAFRQQITRYHPDKVQHLGQEFQDMAAERASEITEAYRVLSNPDLRAAYDRGEPQGSAPPPPQPPPATGSSSAQAAPSSPSSKAETRDFRAQWNTPAPSAPRPDPAGERGNRDAYVRRAAIERFRQVLGLTVGDRYAIGQADGFDVAYLPKSRWFGRGKGPRLAVRFVARVDPEAVVEVWARASRWSAEGGDEVCAFLIGSSLAGNQEISEAVAKQQRRTQPGVRVTLTCLDLRDWAAQLPADAPEIARSLVARLRSK